MNFGKGMQRELAKTEETLTEPYTRTLFVHRFDKCFAFNCANSQCFSPTNMKLPCCSCLVCRNTPSVEKQKLNEVETEMETVYTCPWQID